MSVLHTFYTAFAQRDWAIMGVCYHPEARFSDPVFPDLDAEGVKAMWKMLLTGSSDVCISFTVLKEDAHKGKVQWEAFYTFPKTKRKVHNVVTSTFTIKDGLILKQQDKFSFWAWSRQALGPIGWLLGWSPLLKAQVRSKAMASLRKAMSGRNATA